MKYSTPKTRIGAAVKLLRSFLRVVGDPDRLDDVFTMQASLARLANQKRIDEVMGRIRSNPFSDAAFRTRPRLGPIDLEALGQLPETTLGGAYARFMRDRGLDPSNLAEIPEPRNDVEYMTAHAFETHDLWHVVTGLETDVPGELGLQAFYLGQYEAPFALLLLAAGFLNAAIFKPSRVAATMREVMRGWTLGSKALPLIGRDWKTMWERPLVDVRRELCLSN